MYAALWRRVPGGLAAKILAMIGLAASALALLFFVVFPIVEPRLPWNDVTVNTPPLTTPTVSAPASPSGPVVSPSAPAVSPSASQ
jgi:hypothetical protein